MKFKDVVEAYDFLRNHKVFGITYGSPLEIYQRPMSYGVRVFGTFDEFKHIIHEYDENNNPIIHVGGTLDLEFQTDDMGSIHATAPSYEEATIALAEKTYELFGEATLPEWKELTKDEFELIQKSHDIEREARLHLNAIEDALHLR